MFLPEGIRLYICFQLPCGKAEYEVFLLKSQKDKNWYLLIQDNNPDCRTASEIVELRHIKANLVSLYVERLVQTGYLIRQSVKGDRRKTELFCTDKAVPVIEHGRQLQNAFFEKIFDHTDDEMRKTFFATLDVIGTNLDSILKEDH